LGHSGVVLALANVISGVLEDASLAVRALGGVVQEVLANRGQVLAAQTFLLLELVLAVGKPTALLLLAVFAVLAVEPEAAELSLDLFFPAIFQFNVFGERGEYVVHSHGWGLARELFSDHGRLEVNALHVEVLDVCIADVAALRGKVGASGDGGLSVNVGLLRLFEG
jgi:hypothetical protein